jgi:hypothetical protein
MSIDLTDPYDRKALGLPPLDMEAVFIKLYVGEPLTDEEVFAIRPRWLRDQLEESGLSPTEKLQIIHRVQRLKDDLERRNPYYGFSGFQAR